MSIFFCNALKYFYICIYVHEGMYTSYQIDTNTIH
jgi:hypothetical protein